MADEVEKSAEKLGLVTLSARLIDPEFRDGYKIGYELALADILKRASVNLAGTPTLVDLRDDARALQDDLREELTSVLPYEDDFR